MNPFVRASSNTLMSSLRVITDRKLWKAPLHVFCILTCILECCKDCLEIGYRGVAWRLSLFGYSVDFSCRKSASGSRKIRGLWQTNEKEALGGWEPDGPFGCIFRHVAGGRCPLVGLKVWRVRHWFWSPTIWIHILNCIVILIQSRRTYRSISNAMVTAKGVVFGSSLTSESFVFIRVVLRFRRASTINGRIRQGPKQSAKYHVEEQDGSGDQKGYLPAKVIHQSLSQGGPNKGA